MQLQSIWDRISFIADEELEKLRKPHVLQTSVSVELVEKGRGSIRGRVAREDNNQAMNDAWVVAYARTGELDLRAVASARTDWDGIYTIPNLPADAYDLKAVAYPYWNVSPTPLTFTELVTLADNETTTVAELKMRHGRKLTGKVLDAETSAAIAGALLYNSYNSPFVPERFTGKYQVTQCGWGDDMDSYAIERVTTSTSQGRYVIDGMPWFFMAVPRVSYPGYRIAESQAEFDRIRYPDTIGDQLFPRYFIKSSGPRNTGRAENYLFQNEEPIITLQMILRRKGG
jgi:hypothetical protein